jgi:hypothetical protein
MNMDRLRRKSGPPNTISRLASTLVPSAETELELVRTTNFLITLARFSRYDDVMRFAVFVGVLFVFSGVCKAGSPAPFRAAGAALSVHQTSANQANEIVGNLESSNENVRVVLRTLFKSKNRAYSVHPDVQGSVTVSLSRIPFEVALNAVIRQVGATFRLESGIYLIEPRSGNWPPNQNAKPGDEIGDKIISTSSNSDEDIRDFLARMFSELDISFAISPKIEGKANGRFNSMKLKDVLAHLGEVHGFYAELRSGCYVVQPLLQQGFRMGPTKITALHQLVPNAIAIRAALDAPSVGHSMRAERLVSMPAADAFTSVLRQMKVRYRIEPKLPKISGSLPAESHESRLYRLKMLSGASIKVENGIYVVRLR